MGGFFRDLQYAGRTLVKQPGLAVISITALAMGIGFTSIMFSIVHAALLRGLPFDGGERIMHVERTNPTRDIESMGVSIHDYLDWREQQSSYEHLSAYYEGTVNLRGTEKPIRYSGAFVTANTFPTIGVQPEIGRLFREDEDEPGAAATAILSYHVWQDLYAGSADALGQVVTVNGEQAEVVGVMPDGFRFPVLQDIWLPLRMDPLALERDTGTWLEVFGKLRNGVSIDQAMLEFTGIAGQLADAYPEYNEGTLPLMKPFTQEFVGDEAVPLLWTMLAIVSLVLLIACVNVANLLLARAALRVKEMGIRTAMGAHRMRIISQMVAEALALALVGAALGAGIAWIGIDFFAKAVEGTDPPYWLTFQLDGTILLFILGISVMSAVVSGVIPALKATGADITTVLKDESRGSSSLHIGRMSRWLVIGQLAMSVGLLVAAGLMTKSIITLRNFDYGFEHEGVFTARAGLFEADFPTSADRVRFYEEVHQELSAIPGVRAASISSALPGLGSAGSAFALEGVAYSEDRDFPTARQIVASPDYFATFGVEVQQGRDFNAFDNEAGIPVAIVNQSFVSKHLPEGPVGKRIRMGRSDSEEPWLTIVGVVPDLYMEGIGNTDGDPAGFYVPMAQGDPFFMSLAAVGPANPMSLSTAARDAVTAVNAEIPIYWLDTLEGRMAGSTWIYNVFGALFVVFGICALFLASVGLYGVMSFSVGRRTTEMGIRMALGARGPQVLRMILRQGMTQIGIGLVLGLGLAFVVSRALQLVLFEVSPNDPAVFILITAVLAATGLLASTIPARRATRVDPMVALRQE
ncbi:MAG: ABC transporter permease [Longimicrobiales bacterium]